MMKRYLKKVLSVFLVLLISLSVTACSGRAVVKPYRYNQKLKRNNISSVVAAKNNKYELLWDRDSCLVYLYDKKSEKSYCSVPPALSEDDGFGSSSDGVLKMQSPITIDCVRSETYEIKTGYGADCLCNGDFSVSMIDKGIRVTYIFDELKVSVPVKYLLFDDGIKIEIDPAKIAEDGGEYFLHSISLAPFMCSTENMKSKSYIFYPSGSGALINMDKQREVSVNYVSEIYGRDRMSDIPTWCKETNTEDVKMPVFGAVNGGDGLFAIIDSGAESGNICIDAFNSGIGYSAAYPEFAVRGETSVSNKFLSSSVNSIKYSDYFSLTPISVLYYPLSGDNASYNGMAEIYRNYLKKSGMKEKKNDNSLSVKILGGAMIDDSSLGVPTRKMFATTTLKETESIVSDLTGEIGENVNIDLVGYGKTGLEIGEICGGFTVAGKLGGKSGLKNAYKNMTDSGNSVYFDMDPVSIKKSGKGFSVSNVAVTTTRQRGDEKYYNISSKNSKQAPLCYFISRSLISKAVNKSISALKKFGVSGVALDAAASYSYSDYSEQEYYSKGQMAKDVSSFIKTYKKNNISVMTNSANIYAAMSSDICVDVPVGTSKMDFFSEEIPFYQMVMQGFIPMYSPSLNLSNNSRDILLKSAESGIGISYTVMKNFTGKLRYEFDIYENACFDDLKQTIKDDYSLINDLHKSVNGERITTHSILKNGVRKTVFSNGISVYTNFGSKNAKTPLGNLKPYSFIFGKEAVK